MLNSIVSKQICRFAKKFGWTTHLLITSYADLLNLKQAKEYVNFSKFIKLCQLFGKVPVKGGDCGEE